MLPPKSVLFSLATVQKGIVVILFLYSVITLFKVKKGDKPAKEGCIRLNIFITMALLAHAIGSLLIGIRDQTTLFYINLLLYLIAAVYFMVKNKGGVYDAETMQKTGKIRKYIAVNCVCCIYHTISLISYALAAIDEFKTQINWGELSCANTLLFVSVVCLTEAMIAMLIYFTITISSIEEDGSRAKDQCQLLNKLLVVKIIIISALTCVLVKHAAWGFFFANIQILRWEICKLNLDNFHIENIRLPREARRHVSYNKMCILHFWGCLSIYIYGVLTRSIDMQTSMLLVALPMLVLELHKMSVEEWGISSVLSFSYYLITGQLKHQGLYGKYFHVHLLEWLLVLMYWSSISIDDEGESIDDEEKLNVISNVIQDLGLLTFVSFLISFFKKKRGCKPRRVKLVHVL